MENIKQIEQNKENNLFEEHIDLITRQTDLSNEQAVILLQNHNGDYMKALQDYFGIQTTHNKIAKNRLTINQQIYSEIRNVMDDASYRFYNQSERK
jgi:predicted metal-dependent hydrolase